MTIDLSKATRLINWTSQKLTLHSKAAKAQSRKVQRGHVYRCYFGENIGSEESKERPCVVIQNNVGNIHSPNTIVAPITNSPGETKTTVPITTQFNPDGTVLLSGYILLSSITTVSKARLGDRITALMPNELADAEQKILASLGLFEKFKSLEDRLAADKKHIRRITQERYDLEQLLTKLREAANVQSNEELLEVMKKLQN